jgi:hypothetical protein
VTLDEMSVFAMRRHPDLPLVIRPRLPTDRSVMTLIDTGTVRRRAMDRLRE